MSDNMQPIRYFIRVLENVQIVGKQTPPLGFIFYKYTKYISITSYINRN